jgi:16S rRNA (guanine966-N2)-methyltransferase
MRIIAGKFRGRKLAAPVNDDIRPTTDRIRESLFAILDSRYPDLLRGTRILDLFAGTGALGLEALSRGAQFALFVENSSQGYGLVRKNIENFGAKSQTKSLRADATQLGPIGEIEPFDLVFADPPYGKRLDGKRLAETAVNCLVEGGWLSPEAIVVIEDKAVNPPPILPTCKILDERKFGDTKVWIYTTRIKITKS